MRLHALAVGVVSLVVSAGLSPAHAQLIEGPIGAVGGVWGGHRPIDPNRNTQALDVTFDLGSGWDRDPNAFLIEDPDDNRDLTSWYATTATASGRYRAGSVRRSIEASGRSYFNYQSNAADSLIGGGGNLVAATQLKRLREHELSAELDASYEPGWVFGALGPDIGGGGPQDPGVGVAPPIGIVEHRWLVLTGSTAYEHHWTRRSLTRVDYERRHLRPLEGGGDETDWQFASLEQRWESSPNLTLLAGYRFDQSGQTVEGLDAPNASYQTLDGGWSYTKRFSPIRRYTVSLRAGASRLFESELTDDLGTWHPAVTGAFEYAPSPSWSMSAEVSRNVTILAGLDPAPVSNDNVEVSLNGTPNRKLRWSISASMARASTLATSLSRASVIDVAGANAQVRYAIATWSAIFASYGFYHHRLEDESILVSGFPPRYDRQSIRVGLTLWVPLYGSF